MWSAKAQLSPLLAKAKLPHDCKELIVAEASLRQVEAKASLSHSTSGALRLGCADAGYDATAC
jgi:hypothetical protein